VDEALAVTIADEKKRRQWSMIEERYEQLTQWEREIMNFLIPGKPTGNWRIGASSHDSALLRANRLASAWSGCP
jgi:FixJ family two-component response regulator